MTILEMHVLEQENNIEVDLSNMKGVDCIELVEDRFHC
jgi:hypothetical protein